MNQRPWRRRAAGPLSRSDILTVTQGSKERRISTHALIMQSAGSIGDVLGRYSGSKPKIVGFGDSFFERGSSYGWAFTFAPNLPGLTGSPIIGGSFDSPAGIGILQYRANAKTLRWTANGDAPGQLVEVSRGGVYYLRSGGGSRLRIGVIPRLLPGADANIEMTRGTFYWRKNPGTISGAIDAITDNTFEWLPNLGVLGSYASDHKARCQQVIEAGADIVLDNGGVNSINAGIAPESIAADRVACWDTWLEAGIVVIAYGIAARNDPTPIGNNDDNYTDAKRNAAHQTNYLLAQAARARAGKRLYFVDTFASSVDPSSGNSAAKPASTDDGLHAQGQMSYGSFAQPTAKILRTLCPMIGISKNVGAAMVYNAATRPFGNHIIGSHASFSGNAGAKGAGVTGDIPDGHTSGRTTGATVSAVARSKVTDPEGGAPWHVWAVSGAAVAGETLRDYISVQIANLISGKFYDCTVEYWIRGEGCTGLWLELLMNSAGAPNGGIYAANPPTDNSLRNINAGIRSGERGKLSLRNMPYFSDPANAINGIRSTVFWTSNVGATFEIGLRNWDFSESN